MTFADYDIDTGRRMSGQIVTTCPKCSHDRKKKNVKCLSVNIDKGLWKCHHCNWSGGLQKKQYALPKWDNVTSLPDNVVEWFLKRNIKQETLVEMGITEKREYMPQVQSERQVVCFPYLRDKVVCNVKYRTPDKHFKMYKDAELIFYNIDGIKGQEECIIVEGEIDALTLIQLGYKNTISVPNGASKGHNNMQYLDNCYQDFEAMRSVVICTDNDEPGNNLANELARRIGVEKCSRALLGEFKDVNEMYCKTGKVEFDIKPFPIEGVFGVSDHWEGMLNLIKNGFPKGWKPRGKIGQQLSIHPGYTTVITGIPGHGKALYLGMEIPTPKGFKKMADIQVGDKVFDENGNQCNVLATKEWSDRPCYELEFSDGTKVIADENHEWLTDTWKSRRSKSNRIRIGQHPLKVRGTDQSIKRTFAEVRTTIEIFKTLKTKNDNRNNHSIKLAGAINIERKRLPIHPYVLGCWLGDGRTDYASISCADTEIIERIKCLGYEVSKQSEKYQYGLLGVVGKLKKLNLVGNKHIPNEYLFSSKYQRLELLKGLMDTDGSISKDSSCEFTSIKKELAESVKDLVCSLGIRATMIEGDAKIDGVFISKKYRVLFKPPFNVFCLKRKSKRITNGNRIDCRYIVSCKPIGNLPTKCIQVDSDSHLFLCTKSFIPTHNSEIIDQLCLQLSLDYNLKGAYFSPENRPTEVHLLKIVEKLIGKSAFKTESMLMEKAKQFLEDRYFWLYPNDGYNLDNILEKARQAVLKFGINWFVIDPWNKLEHQYTESETKHVSESLDKIANFNHANGTHCFIVAHPRKMSMNAEKYDVPGLYDISGSANFYNKTDIGLSMYKESDGVNTLFIQKVKFKYWGDGIAEVPLYWDRTNGRYTEQGSDPTNWLAAHSKAESINFYEKDETPF